MYILRFIFMHNILNNNGFFHILQLCEMSDTNSTSKCHSEQEQSTNSTKNKVRCF